MPEQKPAAAYNVPVWGLFLLFLGIVFLLQTLGILPWGLWGTLWRFWPVLIIAVGVGILLRHYHPWLVGLLMLALFFACLGIAFWQYGPQPAGQTTKSFLEPLDNLESARVEIDFTAGNLVLGSLPPGSTNFVEVSEVGKSRESIRVDFHRQDGEGRFLLSTEGVNRQFRPENCWEVMFARDVPLTLDIKSAASSINLDLNELYITILQLDLNAGNYTLAMPSPAGDTRVNIKADVANIEVVIPEGAAARIKAVTNLAGFDIDLGRFPLVNGYYVSDNFDSAENRIDMEINCDIGMVQIK